MDFNSYLIDRYNKTKIFYVRIRIWYEMRNLSNDKIYNKLHKYYIEEIINYVPSLNCIILNTRNRPNRLKRVSKLHLKHIDGNAYNKVHYSEYYNIDTCIINLKDNYKYWNDEQRLLTQQNNTSWLSPNWLLDYYDKDEEMEELKESILYYWNKIYEICDELGYEYVPYTEVTEWAKWYNNI